jgi:molecular chaperone DnaK
MKDEAVANEKADKERLEFSQVKNELDSIVFQAEKMMKDFEEKTTEDDRKKIDDLIAEAKEILAGTDVEKMKDITKSLVESLQEISTKVYSQEQEKSGDVEPSMDSAENTEAEEVEFEEVKG